MENKMFGSENEVIIHGVTVVHYRELIGGMESLVSRFRSAVVVSWVSRLSLGYEKGMRIQQGWRTFLRARAQIIDNFQTNYFACSW
jgi:hypothetical protein